MTVATTHAAATAAMGETQRIALSLITPVQMREETSDRVVQQYARDMARPTQVFPPIVLFFDGEHYWLADGMHRMLAAQTLGLADIEARVLVGGEREAVEYAALEAPKDHSKVAYGEGDKQLRVKRMWETHPEWHHGGASNVKIAESCGVSEYTVRQARERYDLSSLRNEDKSSPSSDTLPAQNTTAIETSEQCVEAAATTHSLPQATPTPKTPAVTVTRTSKHGKVTTYQQHQPQRRKPSDPTPETETEPPMAAERAFDDPEPEDDDGGPDPALAMKMGTVVHLMTHFHNKVQATLGGDTPDKATLDAWWNSVEPRDWQAFQEHFRWLRRVFAPAINDFMNHYHTDSGHWTTPPMVRELRPKSNRKQ